MNNNKHILGKNDIHKQMLGNVQDRFYLVLLAKPH